MVQDSLGLGPGQLVTLPLSLHERKLVLCLPRSFPLKHGLGLSSRWILSSPSTCLPGLDFPPEAGLLCARRAHARFQVVAFFPGSDSRAWAPPGLLSKQELQGSGPGSSCKVG